MLDKRSLALLNIINSQCIGSGYKVFALTEFEQEMPICFGVQLAELIHCINGLAERDYISVKYIDGEQVCLCLLPKGRFVFENRIDVEIEKKHNIKSYFTTCFLASFLGGFIGMAISLMIFKIFGGI